MALPTSATTKRAGSYAFSGVELGIFPSTDKTLTIELQSATANSTASSMWQSQVFPPTQNADFRFTYMAPFSTRRYYFRARHPAQPGYSAGAFTPTVSARPTALGTIQRPVMPQMTYAGNVEIPSGSDVWVSSSKTVKVGTQITTGVRSKTIRMGFGQFHETQPSTRWVYQNAYVEAFVASAVINTNFRGGLDLPRGVTVTALKARVYRESTADLARFIAVRIVGTTAVFGLVSSTQTSTGWADIGSSVLAEAITSTNAIAVEINLRKNTTAGAARFAYVDVTYRMPSYDKAY